MTPQLLILGHIVKDIQPNGWSPGGGALYAAAQAARLGIETAVVTATDVDIEPRDLVPGVDWHVVRLDRAIQFENTYAMGKRTQRVRAQARPLTLDDVPVDWRDASQVFLAPVFQDIDPRLPGQLVKHSTMVGIGAQGLLRRTEGDRVQAGVFEPAPDWLYGDVVFLSEEDVDQPDALGIWQERVPVIVLTRGSSGYTVWDADGRHDLAPIRGCERDPTGAGDVFATAYMVRYAETHDVLTSARFGAAAAAVSVEGEGIASVPGREQIEARLASAAVAG